MKKLNILIQFGVIITGFIMSSNKNIPKIFGMFRYCIFGSVYYKPAVQLAAHIGASAPLPAPVLVPFVR